MSDALPPLYAAWMTEVFPGPIPEETQATCQQCVMCSSPGNASAQTLPLTYFNAQTKCCTYLPRLPNFLVGRILADETPEMRQGRVTVEQRLQKGVVVTPLGFGKEAVFNLLYQEGKEAVFGKSRALRCPHYIEKGGLCGIWRHRESTCVTWFCKYVRGSVGRDFWDALKQLLFVVEESLARWCVQQLDIGNEALRLLFASTSVSHKPTLDNEQLDGAINPARYRALWGKWVGREQEFYRASASLVNALSWEEIVAICGPELTITVQLAQEAYTQLLDQELPPALSVRPLHIVQMGQSHSHIIAYRGYDPLRLPNVLLDVLPYFDGRPLEETLEAIATEQHLTLDKALLRKLVDFAVLALPPETTS